jgi:hypothetical protein
VAQPTDTPERFEVSEPSTALPVPALSRYARPEARRAEATAQTASDEPVSAAEPAKGRVRPDAQPEADETHRRLDPIVEAASDEWATDPSPPQPVRDTRSAGPASASARTGPGSSLAPAIREARARKQDESKRRPFWKRLSMVRPAGESSSPPAVEIPKDLLKPAIERIDHLTRRFEREQKVLYERLDEFEHNLTRLWELEEQMGLEEIRAQLAVMRADQEEIADGLHALTRRMTIGASAVVAIFGALLIWLAL